MIRLRSIALFAVLGIGTGVLCAQTAEQLPPPPKPDEFGDHPPGPPLGPPPEGGRFSRGDHGDRGDGKSHWRGRREMRNPMEDFRRMLALTPEERVKEVANKPEHIQKFLLSRLAEYDALTPEQRELRLRSTELRWDMMYLLRVSPERRQEKLAKMSDDQRKLVEERLKQWDTLAPDLQQEVLEHQSTLYYAAKVEAAPAASKEDVFANMSPDFRDRLKKRIEDLHSLPKEQLARMVDNFHKIFELSDNEQERILATLPNDERAQIENKIAEFEKLPPSERKHCLESMRKFTNLSESEQARFMATAERWEKMTEEERNAWRNLFKKMPPLPPGLQPPLPPGADPQAFSPPVLPAPAEPAPQN